MPDNLSVLSDSDVAALRDIIARVRRSHGPRGGDLLDASDLDYTTPEVYLAQAPAGGLPAASSSGVLGVADCQIYRTVPSGGGITEAMGYQKTVYNPGSSAVAPGTLFLATRDKFGVWYCSAPGGAVSASGLGRVVNLVTNVCPVYTSGTGSGSGAGGNSLTGLNVEKTSVTLPAGALVGAVSCSSPGPHDCCPPPKIPTPCSTDPVPQLLYLTISGLTGGCSCLNGTYTLTGPAVGTDTSGGATWLSPPSTCGISNPGVGDNQSFSLICTASRTWVFRYSRNVYPSGYQDYTPATVHTNPFSASGSALVYNFYACTGGLGGQTYNYTITE